MDILIVALSALLAALIVLALAVLWVASHYDRASSELSSGPPPEQPIATPARGRFRRRARARASARR